MIGDQLAYVHYLLFPTFQTYNDFRATKNCGRSSKFCMELNIHICKNNGLKHLR